LRTYKEVRKVLVEFYIKARTSVDDSLIKRYGIQRVSAALSLVFENEIAKFALRVDEERLKKACEFVTPRQLKLYLATSTEGRAPLTFLSTQPPPPDSTFKVLNEWEVEVVHGNREQLVEVLNDCEVRE